MDWGGDYWVITNNRNEILARTHTPYLNTGAKGLKFSKMMKKYGIKLESDDEKAWRVIDATHGHKEQKQPKVSARRVSNNVTVDFANESNLINKPTQIKINWSHIEYNGNMGKDQNWLTIAVPHAKGGKHEMFLEYAAKDSRPLRVKIKDKIVAEGVGASQTGGWDWKHVQASERAECIVDLGEANTVTEVSFCGHHYMPHLRSVTFVPVDKRHRVVGMPTPQDVSLDSGEPSLCRSGGKLACRCECNLPLSHSTPLNLHIARPSDYPHTVHRASCKEAPQGLWIEEGSRSYCRLFGDHLLEHCVRGRKPRMPHQGVCRGRTWEPAVQQRGPA